MPKNKCFTLRNRDLEGPKTIFFAPAARKKSTFYPYESRFRGSTNCIFFASPRWDDAWGGETLLFNQTGLRIIEKILPKPNRLVVFSHSSSSFHGTGMLNCPESIKRNTYYMDFYIPKSEYCTVKAHLKKTFGVNFPIWRHGTTFIPFAPLGIKSFSLKDFLSRTRYFPSFLLYWLIFLFRPLEAFNKSRIR